MTSSTPSSTLPSADSSLSLPSEVAATVVVRKPVTSRTMPLSAAACAAWPRAPRCTSWSSVSATEGVCCRSSAEQPTDSRLGVLLGKPTERDQGGLRRRAGSCDRDVLACVTLTGRLVAEVRHPVADPTAQRGLACRWQPIATEGIRLRPRTGGVDHRLRENSLLAVRSGHVHGERFCFSAGVDEQVATALRDAGDRGVVPHTVTESVR